jgi:hypothetical protein
MKTLTLTTPPTKGPEVKKLQTLLKTNQFGSFYKNKVDGIFGTYTGNAIKEAKYALGYPTEQILAIAGDPLESYLDGSKGLPILFKARRNSRMKKHVAAQTVAKTEGTIGEKAVKSAVRFIGTAESPAGSNKVMFSDWYGIQGPWCAMFVTYNMVSAGSKAFQKGNRWAYCPFVVDDARASRNGVKQVSAANVQTGDIVLYDWNGDGIADHIGIFEGWTDKKKTKFTAIEGNTSGKNPSDGGEVARTNRDMKNVLIFAHVQY